MSEAKAGPKYLAGYVYLIPIRKDLADDDFYADRVEACELAMLGVNGVQSSGQAMGARPFHLVEVVTADNEQADPAEIERLLIQARDSVPAGGMFCRECERFTLHKKYPLDYKCGVCGEWFYGDGQDLTQEEWDLQHNNTVKITGKDQRDD